MWKVLATTALLITLTACETPSVKNRPGDELLLFKWDVLVHIKFNIGI